MKIQLNTKNLQNTLKIANNFVNRKSRMPILNSMHVRIYENYITYKFTDLETYISIGDTALNDCKNIEFIVNINELYTTIKKTKDESITLDIVDNKLSVITELFNTTINLENLDEYPNFPNLESDSKFICKLEADKLHDYLNNIKYCMSKDETRYNICSAYFEHLKDINALRIVTINGHYLGTSQFTVDYCEIDNLLLPRDSVLKLIKTCKLLKTELTLHEFDGFLSLEASDINILIRKLDGIYPDYKQVLVTDKQTIISVSCSKLLEFLESINIIDKDYTYIKFEVTDKNLVLNYDNSMKLELPFRCREGKDITIGLNHTYLLNILKTLDKYDDTVTFSFTNNLSTTQINGYNNLELFYTVMPMRFE